MVSSSKIGLLFFNSFLNSSNSLLLIILHDCVSPINSSAQVTANTPTPEPVQMNNNTTVTQQQIPQTPTNIVNRPKSNLRQQAISAVNNLYNIAKPLMPYMPGMRRVGQAVNMPAMAGTAYRNFMTAQRAEIPYGGDVYNPNANRVGFRGGAAGRLYNRVVANSYSPPQQLPDILEEDMAMYDSDQSPSLVSRNIAPSFGNDVSNLNTSVDTDYSDPQVVEAQMNALESKLENNELTQDEYINEFNNLWYAHNAATYGNLQGPQLNIENNNTYGGRPVLDSDIVGFKTVNGEEYLDGYPLTKQERGLLVFGKNRAEELIRRRRRLHEGAAMVKAHGTQTGPHSWSGTFEYGQPVPSN